MKPEIRIILLIAALLVITPVFQLMTVIDVALVPRFLCLSVVLMIGIFLFFKTLSQKIITELRWFDTCFLIYYLASAISLFWALNTAEGIFAVQRIFAIFIVYLILRFLLSEYGDKALRIIFISNVVTTLLVLCGVFWQMSDSPTIFRLAYREFTAITGFSAQRNLLCSFLYLTLIFNILFSVQLKQQIPRIACFGLIVLQIFILLLFQTRAVYVALAVSGLFFIIGFQWITRFFNLKKIIVFATILAGLIGLVWARYYFYDDDFIVYLRNFDVRQYLGSGSANQRFQIWKQTMLLIQEKPLTGTGAGNWEIFFPKNGLAEIVPADKDIFFQRPHNDFLWVFSETGVLGFWAYAGMFFVAFFTGFKSLKNATKDIRLNIWILLSGLIGYILIANLSFPSERIEHQIWLMLLFAVLFFYEKNDKKLQTQTQFQPQPQKKTNENKGFEYSQNGNSYFFKLPFKIDARVLLLLALAGLSLNLVIGYHRYQGEKAMRIVYRDSTPNTDKKRLLTQAQSTFFNLDHVGFPLPWYAGIVASTEGNYPQANAHFTEAYQLNPYNYKVLADLASTNGQLKNYDAAKQYLLEAHKINRNNPATIFNLAVLYYNLKDRQAAIEWANKLPNTYPRKRELLQRLGMQ